MQHVADTFWNVGTRMIYFRFSINYFIRLLGMRGGCTASIGEQVPPPPEVKRRLEANLQSPSPPLRTRMKNNEF